MSIISQINNSEYVDKINRHFYIVLFLLAIITFCGGFLSFSIQPAVAKRLLPYFGGVPSVWTSCQLFFQILLLISYLTIHYGFKTFDKNKFTTILFLLATYGIMCSIDPAPNLTYPNLHKSPVKFILASLFKSLAIPMIFIFSLTPLITIWFGNYLLTYKFIPFSLFVASNTGSLIGLLSYPFLIEPNLTLDNQFYYWKLMYLLLITLFSLLFIFSDKQPLENNLEEINNSSNRKFEILNTYNNKPSTPISSSTTSDESSLFELPNFGKWKYLIWLLLSFTPCSLMLAITNYISIDVAAGPIIWVFPLSAYLISWILPFSGIRYFLLPKWLDYLFASSFYISFFYYLFSIYSPIYFSALIHTILVLLVGLDCHGSLFLLKPKIEEASIYYICMGLGGVLAGVFNGIISPIIFTDLYEIIVSIILATLLHSVIRSKLSYNRQDILLSTFIFLLVFLIISNKYYILEQATLEKLYILSGFVISIILSLKFIKYSSLVYLLTIISCLYYLFHKPVGIIYRSRSFYGTYKVYNAPFGMKVLCHGNIIHGGQRRNVFPQSYEKRPYFYFIYHGPFGKIFNELRRRKANKIAVIGLGVGTLATYARPWQNISFFEIDPEVVKIASDTNIFTYLRESQGKVEIIEGDGRINLRKLPNHSLDAIICDAYSSDSVPVHLLTVEAFNEYFLKLKENGLLCLQVTNRYLYLPKIVYSIAHFKNLSTLHWLFTINAKTRLNYDDDELPFIYDHEVIVLAKNSKYFNWLPNDGNWNFIDTSIYYNPKYVWTDNYSSILHCLRW